MYRTIEAVHAEGSFSVQLLCDIAGIPRSSYYKWLNRKPGAREMENRHLMDVMISIYEKVDGIFGYRQLGLHMRRQAGKPINDKRVLRLMRVKGIQSVIRRKKKKYPRSTPQHVAENLLSRQFYAEKPNEKWVTDVTEFKYGRDYKAYLSAVLDLHDNTIISAVFGRSNNNSLVFETVQEAIQVAQGSTPLLHSDRGFQYTSSYFKKLLEAGKVTHSMSGVGRCIDNSPMESFWGTLKCERYYLRKYNTFEELKHDIEDYITFYNNERLQAKLNGLSPLEFRTKAA